MRRFILTWFVVATVLLAATFSAGLILTGPQLVLAIWGYYGSGMDAGPGVAEDKLSSIFESFYRAGGVADGGSGFGWDWRSRDEQWLCMEGRSQRGIFRTADSKCGSRSPPTKPDAFGHEELRTVVRVQV